MVTLKCDSQAIFFMADAHLGLDPGGDPKRIRAITSFFDHVRARRGSLFILGDFFDFWFEYRSVIPRRHFSTLAAMRGLTDSGVEVTYVGGNHDFWVGDFLREEIGLRALTGSVDLDAQGRRVFLAHGDGLAQRDRLYPLLRGILHSRAVTALYRLIHPDVGLPLARRFSMLSRDYNTDWAPDTEDLWRDVATPRFGAGFDAVILGHIHKPAALTRDGKSLFVLGDWISRFSYLTLSGGAFDQLRWREPR
jgi:UDP-2,3-diacylglucosamine hydrolase